MIRRILITYRASSERSPLSDLRAAAAAKTQRSRGALSGLRQAPLPAYDSIAHALAVITGAAMCTSIALEGIR